MKIDKWYLTDGEIASLFRQAIDKPKELRIISELTLRPVPDVINKLREIGFDMTAYEKYEKPPAQIKWSMHDIRRLVQMKEHMRLPWREIADTLRRSEDSCQRKYARIKEGVSE